MNENSL